MVTGGAADLTGRDTVRETVSELNVTQCTLAQDSCITVRCCWISVWVRSWGGMWGGVSVVAEGTSLPFPWRELICTAEVPGLILGRLCLSVCFVCWSVGKVD